MQLLRFKTLQGEIQQTHDENLKLLRPQKKTNYMTAIEAVDQSRQEGYVEEVRPFTVVPNAAIASKKFSQIHYLKGYFLLHHLAKLVGVKRFDEYLKYYLTYYAGKLVTSENFFNLFIEYFQLESNLKDELMTLWLDNACLPINEESILQGNMSLIHTVDEEFVYWKGENTSNKRCKSRGVKRKRNQNDMKENLFSSPWQLVLLLEKLLELEEVVAPTLTRMNRLFVFNKRNAEIRHRWCELITKHMYTRKYDDVEHFLVNDQGMGIYLFGELMINGNKRQEKLACDIFTRIKHHMDKSTFQTVSEIVYPNR